MPSSLPYDVWDCYNSIRFVSLNTLLNKQTRLNYSFLFLLSLFLSLSLSFFYFLNQGLLSNWQNIAKKMKLTTIMLKKKYVKVLERQRIRRRSSVRNVYQSRCSDDDSLSLFFYLDDNAYLYLLLASFVSNLCSLDDVSMRK